MRANLLVSLLMVMSGPVSADPRLQCWIRGSSSNAAIVPLEVQSVRTTDDGFVRVESMGASTPVVWRCSKRGRQAMGMRARRRLIYSIPLSPKPAAQPFPTPPGITGAFITGVPVYHSWSFRVVSGPESLAYQMEWPLLITALSQLQAGMLPARTRPRCRVPFEICCMITNVIRR